MLISPHQASSFWSFDNWGANPSATPGTSVVPGASNAQGSWTEIASSANIAEDVYGLYLQVIAGATSGAAKLQLLDIGVDPAGGTSYSPIIQDMAVGESPALTVQGVKEFFFPFFIKAGSSVAVRIRGASATAGTVRIAAKFFGSLSNKHQLEIGSFGETLGAVTASSSGTSITPGNAADGSWVDLGAITRDMWWWQLGYQINDTTMSQEYTYFEVAFGDASNKTTILKVMHLGESGESAGLATGNSISDEAYCPVKAGEHIYVRARCSDAPDSSYQVTVTGVGG